MSGSQAICYFCCGSDPQPVTFGRTEGSSSERKANETGYPCLWLFHRRKGKNYTLWPWMSLYYHSICKEVYLYAGRRHCSGPRKTWNAACSLVMLSFRETLNHTIFGEFSIVCRHSRSWRGPLMDASLFSLVPKHVYNKDVFMKLRLSPSWRSDLFHKDISSKRRQEVKTICHYSALSRLMNSLLPFIRG